MEVLFPEMFLITLLHMLQNLYRPGSIRVASNNSGSLSNVAFETPEKKKVLIVLNDGAAVKLHSI